MSIKVIGHRGVPVISPENTILGFETAMRVGCDAIELDVRDCADFDHFPVIHDASVSRTTGGEGDVSHMSYSNLKNLDAGSGESIPDLQDVLDRLSNKIQVFIEIKNPIIASDIAKIVSENVEAKKWSYENLVVISFYVDAIESVKKVDRNIHVGINIDKNIENIEFQESIIDIDSYEDNIKSSTNRSVILEEGKEVENIANLIVDLKPKYLNFAVDIISSSITAYAHSVDVQVNVWTVDKIDDIAKSIGAGVDGIISNDPLVVMEGLENIKTNS